ncbi:MAG: choice-of-anchor Q domain-containing protein [Dokdonella sp.]
MSIDGYDGGGRILTHSGAGTLSITGLTMIHGYEYEVGGCVRSSGNLALDNVDVRYYTSVTYDTTSYVGGGGGVFVAGNLTMSRSAIAGNLAVAGQLGRAFGGGAYVLGSVDIRDSAITGNYVAAGSGLGNIGGITIVGRAPSTIVNSTISDNAAANNVGGIYAYSQLTLSNSTVSFNEATHGQSTPGAYFAGAPITINSSILSNNTWGDNIEFDLSLYYGSVSGTNNIIMGSNDSPPGTLTTDPHLQPLADNGGPTKTRAILATSAAVNAGSNVAGLSTDQRGPGFPRQSGSQVDIGAFEFQVPPPMTYTIGGTVAGLDGIGLILQQSGGDNLPDLRRWQFHVQYTGQRSHPVPRDCARAANFAEPDLRGGERRRRRGRRRCHRRCSHLHHPRLRRRRQRQWAGRKWAGVAAKWWRRPADRG